MAHDLVIRNGTVVDGTGGPRYRADVGVDEGVITAIGRIREPGRDEVDAEGKVVSPGFVEGHTHMDAQLHWDLLGSSSCYHGVTTAVLGNCGFTLAPCRDGQRDYVLRSLERAEEIPRAAMLEAIAWDWESFPEYLDAIDAIPKGINYAVYTGHSALRTYVMGERAFEETANDDDLAAMRRELEAAVRAGSLGLSTTRSSSHLTADNRPVPSRQADWAEVRALVDVLAGLGAGLFELDSEKHEPGPARDDYVRRVRELSVESGRPIFSMLVVPPGEPDLWRARLAALDDTAEAGGRLIGQVHVAQLANIFGFPTTLPFDDLPAWAALRALPANEQLARLRDPAVRGPLVAEAMALDGNEVRIGRSTRSLRFDLTTVLEHPYGPNPSVLDLARAQGVTPVDVIIDRSVETGLDQLFGQITMNPDLDAVLAILRHPRTVIAASDSGAHVLRIAAASMSTQLLAYWVREREAFSLEEAVRMLTLVPANAFGFSDRGLVREGFRGDFVVFDPATVAPEPVAWADDLPSGARRLTQAATGIAATVVNGEVLLREGEHTGAYPGRLLRGPLARHAGPRALIPA